MELRKINDDLSVSPQIQIGDVLKIKDAGFSTIVNNRPDGEEDDQPMWADIEAEAKRVGLKFVNLPVVVVAQTPDVVEQTGRVLSEASEPVLLYCRSGTRCTQIWALTQINKLSKEQILKTALEAGYDLSRFLKDF
ncbi:MAG: TIGR01244 family sulfur transferase [Devosiaceae bacterium]|nr:TIGR01244 family sulfur transferase [Devosiaceae bacterium]